MSLSQAVTKVSTSANRFTSYQIGLMPDDAIKRLSKEILNNPSLFPDYEIIFERLKNEYKSNRSQDQDNDEINVYDFLLWYRDRRRKKVIMSIDTGLLQENAPERKRDGVKNLKNFTNECIQHQHQNITAEKLTQIMELMSKTPQTPGEKNLTKEEFNTLYDLGLRDFRAFHINGIKFTQGFEEEILFGEVSNCTFLGDIGSGVIFSSNIPTSVVFEKNFYGTVHSYFSGTVQGNFDGRVDGYFTGTVQGNFDGKLDRYFNGKVDGYFNASLAGDFFGTVAGSIHILKNYNFLGTLLFETTGSFNTFQEEIRRTINRQFKTDSCTIFIQSTGQKLTEVHFQQKG